MNRPFRWLLFLSPFALGASCVTTPSTLPPINPPPQPPVTSRDASPEQRSGGALAQIGKFVEAPSPRYGVAIFAFPRDKASAEAAHSPEWTNRIVNRLDYNHITAVSVEVKGQTLGEEVEKSGAALNESPEAKAVDVLLVGTLLLGGNTQARLAAFDTKARRFLGKGEFEGEDQDAVIHRAVDDVLGKVNHYWLELRRGEDTDLRLEVEGIREQADVAKVLDALSRIPDVQVTQHEGTSLGEGGARASFHAYFHGDPQTFARDASKIHWKSGAVAARLNRIEGMRFQAVYEK